MGNSEQPFTVFATLSKVHIMLLLNVEQMYTNDNACQNFIGEIGDGNGGYEKSDSEKEVIRVKLIEDGLLVTKLLGITELGQSNAEGIHAAITDKCREMHRELSRSQAGIAQHIYHRGWYTTKNVLGKAGVDCSIINATNQHGRISTMNASIEVAEQGRAYLYKHMGHSEQVYVGTYQRPLPVLAMTKVGAVLANIDASMDVQKRTKPQEPQGNAAMLLTLWRNCGNEAQIYCC